MVQLHVDSHAGSVPARLTIWVNGFLLVNDLTGERSSSRLEPYIRAGENLLEVEITGAVDDRVTVAVQIVDPDNGDPGRSLVSITLPAAGENPFKASERFDLAGPWPIWLWTTFPSVMRPDDPDILLSARAVVARLATLLARGPDTELLDMLRLKHDEIGLALDIGGPHMDAGLRDGLAALRRQDGFRVEMARSAQFRLSWSSDLRLARALRADGTDAIRIGAAGRMDGFEVTLGCPDGTWQVVR
ncbi:hypothetical protein [Niveispirillum fermenti]|uniref:hypothetical protein n=1 Tax=Niveispirillum fermenti TaxID=1233113 RepID=UPI003A880772